MAFEDRERNFEKALRRELRASGASSWDCPDTERLAAYHERMLSPEEMSASKTHILACPRCQEILATLELTEAIPAGSEDPEKAFRKAAAPAPEKAKSFSVREMPKARPYRKWAVPAGAVAAGLLVWIAVSVTHPSATLKQSAPVQVVENREQKEQQPGTSKTELEARVPAARRSDRAAGNEPDRSKQELDALAGYQKGDLTRERAGARGAHDHGPRMTQNQVQSQIQNNRQIAGQKPPSERDDTAKLPAGGQNATVLEENAPQRKEQAVKSAPAALPPAPAAKPAEADKQKDLEAPSLAQTVEVTSADAVASADEKSDKNESAALKKLKGAQGLGKVYGYDSGSGAGALEFVRTPDPKVFWVFAPGGPVMKSQDGGKTTRLQRTGGGLKFLAGSAPDRNTCWLLADGGIVLRTTNGGKTWLTAVTPADMNFTTITALDGTHALITDASGKASYSTTDGGATWNVVPQR
jgi:hypothetical protein